MSNPVIHFEVAGTDAAALQSFYAEVFGWKIDANNPAQYGSVEAAPGGIGGGVCPTIDGSTRTMFYVGVADLQTTLDAVEKLGGVTVLPPADVPGGPKIAMFNDPDGNRVGLMQQA
jgi:predicted enzyme related to lactoylglutathione lyase